MADTNKVHENKRNTLDNLSSYDQLLRSDKTLDSVKATIKKEAELDKNAKKEVEAALKQLRIDNIKELAKIQLEEEKKAAEAELESKKSNNEKLQASWKSWWDKFEKKLQNDIGSGEITGKLTSQLDNVISNYVSAQEQMNVHLVGTNSSLSSLTSTMNSALATSRIVDQSKMMSNMSTLVKSGITQNIEQRAFLATLADQFGMYFAEGGSLNKTIRVLNADITANRASLEYSLTEFLNENYENSQYIAEAMNSVSDSLLQSQSLMSTQEALNYEATVQGWLGALYSLGFDQSTTTNLAKAIDAIGSGDISGLGSNGIANLVLMGASRAGLSYGNILNEGLTSSDTNKLMSGIVSYLQEINGYDSNVVKSQLANIFGVNVSDIVAASRYAGESGSISTNASTFLSNAAGYVPIATQVQNALSNAMFTWGSSIASNNGEYMAYVIENMIADSGLGDIFTSAAGSLGWSSPLWWIGAALNNAPLLSLFTSGAFGDIFDSLSSTISGTSTALSVFNALAGNNSYGTKVSVSGSGTSAGIYVSTGTEDVLASANNFANSDLSNTIETVGDTQEEWETDVSTISSNVAEMLDLLTTSLGEINLKLDTMNAGSLLVGAAYTVTGNSTLQQ